MEIIADKNGNVPKKQHAQDAGFDLESSTELTIPMGSWALVPTSTRLNIPEGFVGKVCSRSGLALKHGVAVLNAPGLVDAGYEGEIGVVLINYGIEPFEVKPGDRIAQLLIENLPKVTIEAGDLQTVARAATEATDQRGSRKTERGVLRPGRASARLCPVNQGSEIHDSRKSTRPNRNLPQGL